LWDGSSKQGSEAGRNESISRSFPLLKELKEGQVITVELKNEDRLTDVVFTDHYHSKLMLGTDGELDKETGEMLIGDVRWVKLSKVMSIEA
jgi:hypothetical protein